MIILRHEFQILEKAKALAAWAHKGQTRKTNDQPYLMHPMRVHANAAALGYPLTAQIACLWHDIIEDGPQDVRTVRDLVHKAVNFGISDSFSKPAADIVGILSKNCYLDKKNYYTLIDKYGNDMCILIKVLDRIDNLREGQNSMGIPWLKKYLVSTRKIIKMAKDRNLQSRPEVAYLIQSYEAAYKKCHPDKK